MRRFTLAVTALLALATVAYVSGGFASAAASPKKGGTLIFGAEQEPPCLNGALDACNNTWTAWTVGTSLRGLYIQKPDFSFAPDMAAGEAKVGRVGGKFALTVRIKKPAV